MIIVSCVFAFSRKKNLFRASSRPEKMRECARCLISVRDGKEIVKLPTFSNNHRIVEWKNSKMFPFMNESKLQRWTSESLSFETRRSWQKRRQKEEERILTVTSSISILIINFVSFLFTFPLQLDVLFIEKVNGGFWRSFLYPNLFFYADCQSTHLGWLRMMCHEELVLGLFVKA